MSEKLFLTEMLQSVGQNIKRISLSNNKGNKIRNK